MRTERQKKGGNSIKPRKIPNLWEFNCFGCSSTNKYGLQLQFYLSGDNECFTECKISDQYCGFNGFVHGGIITTLLDEVAAWTIISQLFKIAITHEITTRYLNPVPTNTIIRVAAEIVSFNEKVVDVRSKITSENGLLLAEADSKWLIPSISTLAKVAGFPEKYLAQLFDKVIQPIKQLYAD
ncbi:MAG: PaaI family thioesterase [Promethearchaeota archaeon]